MVNSIIMYVVNTEAELQVLQPNTAYYIIGKEIRLVDNTGQVSIFSLQKPNTLDARVTACEQQINKIVKHLTSFKEG